MSCLLFNQGNKVKPILSNGKQHQSKGKYDLIQLPLELSDEKESAVMCSLFFPMGKRAHGLVLDFTKGDAAENKLQDRSNFFNFHLFSSLVVFAYSCLLPSGF